MNMDQTADDMFSVGDVVQWGKKWLEITSEVAGSNPSDQYSFDALPIFGPTHQPTGYTQDLGHIDAIDDLDAVNRGLACQLECVLVYKNRTVRLEAGPGVPILDENTRDYSGVSGLVQASMQGTVPF